METVSRALTRCLGERYLIGTAPGSRKRGEEARECGGGAQQLGWRGDGTILHGQSSGAEFVWTDNIKVEYFCSGRWYCYVQVVMLCSSWQVPLGVIALSRIPTREPRASPTCARCLTTHQTTSRACRYAPTRRHFGDSPSNLSIIMGTEALHCARLVIPRQVSRSPSPRCRGCSMQGLPPAASRG